MLEPADSQQAYDLCLQAVVLSERWHIPVLLRLTTRVSHSKSIVQRRATMPPAPAPHYIRDIPMRVMVPGYARPAHRRLRAKLEEIRAWGETPGIGTIRHAAAGADSALGIVASGVAVMHAREAAPRANVLQITLIHPAPIQTIAAFAAESERTVVVEEGDPVLLETCRTAGIRIDGKAELYRFGELDVRRVRRLLAGDLSPEPPPPPGKPPQLCAGCPHRTAFETLRELGCTVSGDIGCYTLGVMPPFTAIDTTVCMGASITVGLGLRQVLPEAEARRVVSVIGDSTFVHSGLTGIAEMVYNPPPTGHVVLILDNGTTAMTGMQEHPGTGRRLDHSPTNTLPIEDVVRVMGVPHVVVIDHVSEPERFADTLRGALADGGLWVIIARRACILAAAKIRQYKQAGADAKPSI
jgi:indolepyruvate ferredoxin oxidoreductase alpha subunit